MPACTRCVAECEREIGAPAAGVDLGRHDRVDGGLAVGDPAAVHDQAGDRRLHVVDRHGEPVAPDRRRRRPAGHRPRRRRACGPARPRRRYPPRPPARRPRRRPARRSATRWSGRCSRGTRCRLPCRAPRGTQPMSPCPVLRALASALARVRCSSMRVRKPSSSTARPGLRRHLQRQVDREAVGVVQLEGLVACQLRAAGLLRRGDRRVEDPRARGEGLQEGVLLGPDDRGDPLEVRGQLRVGRAHLVADHLGEARPAPARARRAAATSARSGAAAGAARSRGPRCRASPRRR